MLGLATLALAVGLWEAATSSSELENGAPTGRKLLSNSSCEAHVTLFPGLDGECNADWEQVGSGAVASIVYIIAVVWLFLGIAVICDNQFTDALEMICSEYGLNLSEDVAGATFMAAGSSAPELATSFVGVFVAKNEVGLGTILGSAVFNILIIIGSTAILVNADLKLDWRPVVRDNFFYCVSVCLLLVLAWDEAVQWYDAMILLIWYFCYLGFMTINQEFWKRVGFPFEDEDDEEEADEEDEGSPLANKAGKQMELKEGGAGQGSGNGSGQGAGGQPQGVINVDGPEEPPQMGDVPLGDDTITIALDKDTPKKKKRASFSTGLWDQEDDEDDDIIDRFCDFVGCPWALIYSWTMPNCKLELLDPKDEDDAETIKNLEEQIEAASDADKHQLQEKLLALTNPRYDQLSCGVRWYFATFLISLLWLTVISYFMVEFILKLGCLWKISSVVMGLTFLAMGTSIPDALGSIAVAKEGEGDMAVSNAVGSNVFDICLGLGLPWFIETAIVNPGRTLSIGDKDEVMPSIFILLAIIIILFLTFVASKWTLKPWVGYILFGVYFVFVIYQIVAAKIKGNENSC